MESFFEKSIDEVHHRAAIGGYVTDAISKQGIASIEVQLVKNNLALKTLKTREDGFFCFIDLPPSQYTLEISIPKYLERLYVKPEPTPVTVQTEPTEILDGHEIPKIDLKANVQLHPTQLVGNVFDNNQPAVNALVYLFGSQLQTETDEKGYYTFSGIESGKQTIRVVYVNKKKEVLTDRQVVSLTAGEKITQNFYPKNQNN
ncbi:hypothetical protein NIES4071_05710 [Calothrix sp. NIES-4071]|nr:hypothetical protein NIES4071_05710 [Calothrix sp. NIES-4071]BAZ54916.1 hypothetical protein NIES4105_05700 [Calothrix sp. NIES-4105]